VSPARENGERCAGVILLPLLATLTFYAVPAAWQANRWIQFLPQFWAYTALALWASLNPDVGRKLALVPLPISTPLLTRTLVWGIGVGLALGALNLTVILSIVPKLGYGYSFLIETPHAQIHPGLMVPWFILCIAFMVEVNFRGFLLGRFRALGLPPLVAIITSAILFAFDPFLVTTFRHLHWIAVWDGLIWGALRFRFDSVYIPILAHAVEVIVLYSVMRAILS
jgi:membrane protease YdiL (CAAX protease family)